MMEKIKGKKLMMHQQIYSIIGGSLAQRTHLVDQINQYKEFKVVNIHDHLLPSPYAEDLYFLNEPCNIFYNIYLSPSQGIPHFGGEERAEGDSSRLPIRPKKFLSSPKVRNNTNQDIRDKEQ